MDTIPPAPGSAVEVEFALSDRSSPFVRASAEAECRFELREVLPRGDGRFGEFFSVTGAEPDRIQRLAEASDRVEPRLVSRHDNGGLFEFVVSAECPVVALAGRGATPTEVTSTDGDGRIVCRIPPEQRTADVISGFSDEHPAAELVAKREPDGPVLPFAGNTLRELLEDRLTDRQREVLRSAYESGYFQRPRETTGESLADELDIRPATLSQHVRAAQHNLLSAVYEADRR